MGVNLPTTVSVTCDFCDREIECDTTEFATDSPVTVGVDDSDIESQGWIVNEDGIYCSSKCANSESESDDDEDSDGDEGRDGEGDD